MNSLHQTAPFQPNPERFPLRTARLFTMEISSSSDLGQDSSLCDRECWVLVQISTSSMCLSCVQKSLPREYSAL